MRLSKSKSFKQFLISYIIILILPFMVSGLVYNKAVTIMQDNSIKFSSNNLNNMKELIERDLSYVDRYILELSIKSELTKIINISNPPEGSSDMYWFYEFFQFYNNMNLDTSKKSNILLLLDTNKIVFGERYVNFSFGDFYTNYFTYEGMNYEQWYEMYFDKTYYRDYIPEKKIRINNVEGNYITSLYTLPIVQNIEKEEKGKGVIAYLFDADEIRRMLKNTIAESGGWAYIVDQNNQVLVSTDTTTKWKPVEIKDGTEGYLSMDMNGEEMLVVHTFLPYVSWTFVSIIPLNSIKADLSQFRYISIGVVSIALFIGLTISLFLSYRNTKPIHTLMDLLPSVFKEKSLESNNEIMCLKNGITRLISDNNKMKESLMQQYNYLHVLYFEKLLKGDLENIQDLEVTRKHVGIDLKGPNFIVMLIRINSMDNLVNEDILFEQDVCRVVLNKALMDASGKKGYIHILNPNELALLLSFGEDEEYEKCLKNIMNMVTKAFTANFTIKPIFAIGNLYNDLLDIHFSLKEARYAIEYILNNGMKDTIIWYKNIEHQYTAYYYTNEIEQRIVNLVRLGNWCELKLFLSRVYLNTIGNKNMSSQLKWVLMNDLCATVVKLSIELKIDVDLQSVEKVMGTGDLEQYYKALKGEYKQICHSLSKTKKSHNEQLKDNILEYIHNNYTNSSLSVAKLSKTFNLSESYFSQFFKEQTNETFSHYVENLRISHASSLLLNTDSCIDDIAERSGYNNTNTFRRAFRRVTGVSPTIYVQANK